MVTIALALARGIYVMRAEHGGDPIVRIGLPENDWMDAMHWIAKTNLNTHVLADPAHAWKYGESVRVAGERDVFLEEVKEKDPCHECAYHDRLVRHCKQETERDATTNLTFS